MKKDMVKKCKRKLAGLLALSVILTSLYIDDKIAFAENKKFYLDNLVVTGIEDLDDMKDQTIYIGDQTYKLDASGKVIVDQDTVKVSGSDVSGSDVSGSDISGSDVSGSDSGRLYIETTEDELEVRIDGAYFTEKISTEDSVQKISFTRKYTVKLSAGRSVSEGDIRAIDSGVSLDLVTAGGVPGRLEKQDDNTYYVSKGTYEFSAIWQGITYNETLTVDSAATETLELKAIFRDYIIYGETGDFYLQQNGTILEYQDDPVFTGKNTQMIFPDNPSPSADRPFDEYRLEKTQDQGVTWSLCESGVVNSSLELEDGWYRLYMIRGGNASEKYKEFKVDANEPQLIAKTWTLGKDGSSGELDKTSAPDLELMDTQQVTLKFTVEDISMTGQPGEAVLFKNVEGTDTDLSYSPVYSKGTKENQHIYTFDISTEVIERGLSIRFTDNVGHKSLYDLYADVIVDRTAPEILGVEISKDDQQFAAWGKETAYVKKDAFLKVKIREENWVQDASLVYQRDGAGEEVTVVSDGYDVKTGCYHFTLKDTEQFDSYGNVTFHIKDKLDNENIMLWGDIVRDSDEPDIKKIMWKKSKAGDETFSITSEKVIVADDDGIVIRIAVQDKNLDEISLALQDGALIETKSAEAAAQQDGDQYYFDFTIDDINYNYKQIEVRAKDKTGNGVPKALPFRVIVDTEDPVLSKNMITTNVDSETGWYSRNVSDKLSYTFEIRDSALLRSISLKPQDPAVGNVEWTLNADDLKPSADGECNYVTDASMDTNGREADTGMCVYRITTKPDRFAGAKEQNAKYQLIIIDEFGHKTVIDNALELKIDNTNPEKKAYVNFAGDKDLFYKVDSDAIEDMANVDNPYEVSQSGNNGTVYNQNYVDLNIYVRDVSGNDTLPGGISGVGKVEVSYLYTRDSVNADMTEDTTVVFPDEGTISDAVLEIAARNDENAKTLLDMKKVTVRIEVQSGQKIAGIRSVKMTDFAGNVSRVGNVQEVAVDKVTYVVDNVAPVLTSSFPTGKETGYKEGDTYYYNKSNPGIYVEVEENNFYAADVKDTAVDEMEAGAKLAKAGEFVYQSQHTYHRAYSLDDGDGIYYFGFTYADRSTNLMTAGSECIGSVAEGTYLSPKIVFDTVAPVVTIQYYKGGKEVTGEAFGGKCFNESITAVITVKEANFSTDAEHVKISFSGKNAKDNSELGFTYNADNWKHEGDTHTYTIECTEEGRYGITAKCTDLAGNTSQDVKTSDYIIDKTVPVVEISYDITTDNGYYNTDRVATITVTEKNFNSDNVNFVLTTSGPQPEISSWRHSGGEGCSDDNHVNGCKWRATVRFHQDGDYTFTFNCTDKAGHTSQTPEAEAFTIDKTIPEVTVSYDNHDVYNGKYYQAARTVTITIHEHNFDENGVTVIQSTVDGVLNPLSAWRNTAADTYAATIAYNLDGEYNFDVDFTDKAGNAAGDYAGDNFVIDLTAPELEITDIMDRSANNGIVTPGAVFEDKNFDRNNVSVRITGVNHGEVSLEQETTNSTNGQTIHFMDFPHTEEMDDLYTLVAVVTDLAGNTTEKSVMFSVNRFGSVYLFSQETVETLDRFYVNHGPRLVVTEINVDTLEFQEITYSRDGDIVTLVKDDDYTVTEEGNEFQWKEYTYEIEGDNFEQEGVYVVTLQSIDRATNDTSNRLKEKNIEFTVDKTVPSVVIAGVDNNATYNDTSRNVTVDVVDNIYLHNVIVYLDGNVLQSFDETDLAEHNGVVNCNVTEANRHQTLYVVASDAAGNIFATDPVRFLLTSNSFVRLINNKGLLIGLIVCSVAILSALNFWLIFKRRRKDEQT